MNMLLKQKLKTIAENQRDNDYQHDLTTEKIDLQKKYIEDIEKNKDKLIQDKIIILLIRMKKKYIKDKKILMFLKKKILN